MALVVVAAPQTSLATTTEFRRVDIAEGRFLDERFSIRTAGIGTSHVVNRSSESGIMLSMSEVEPGSYALLSIRTASPNSYESVIELCLNQHTPVFRLEPGQIAIISTRESWRQLSQRGFDDHLVLQEFEQARVRFPGIIGGAVMLQQQAAISWIEQPWTLSHPARCREPDTFSVLSLASNDAN